MTPTSSTRSPRSPNPARISIAEVSVAAIPIVLIVALCLCYALAPDFYLKYILQYKQREYQAVEIITSLCGLAAGLILIWSAILLWRAPSQRVAPRPAEVGSKPWPRVLVDRGGAKIVAVIALAALFFTGEETSWGQTYFQWDTPEKLLDHNLETNLHNLSTLPFSLNSLGSLFLLVMFVGLPIAWRYREKFSLPHTWAPAIARWPVMFSILVAFAWKEVKTIYRLLWPTDKPNRTQFYTDFIDQLNEQKEMLIAVTLLMYALYRLQAARAASRERSASGT